MELQETLKPPNQHAGVKRKSTSPHCPIEQPPQKRHKSNAYYKNRLNIYDDDDDESLQSESPPFILFSPQQSTDTEADQHQHNQHQQSDIDEPLSESPTSPSYVAPRYNPDIIQGFEHLIPSKRYNPFYDSYTIHNNSNDKEENIIHSEPISCEPSSSAKSLPFESETDKTDQNNGNSQKDHNNNNNTDINDDNNNNDDDDDKEENDKRGTVEGGGPPITIHNHQNNAKPNDENTEMNTNCNHNCKMNIDSVSDDKDNNQNLNESKSESGSEKESFALEINIQINEEIHHKQCINNGIQHQNNNEDDTLTNIEIQTQNEMENNEKNKHCDDVDNEIKNEDNEIESKQNMEDSDNDMDQNNCNHMEHIHEYHDQPQLQDEEEDDDDDIHDFDDIGCYNNNNEHLNNNNVIELLSDDTESDEAMDDVDTMDNTQPQTLNNSNNDDNNDTEYNNMNGVSESKQTEFMRYPQDSPKPVIVTIGDIGRLRPSTYLNDSIIDFYLKYLYNEILNEEQQNDTHIFSQFFYTKLDQTIDENNEKGRLKLAKWTKNVNIFGKKLLIIPIHNALHWSLAIITNPGYEEPLIFDEDTHYEFCRNEVLSIISRSVFNEAEWIHTLCTNKEILAITNYPRKILHFDSMRGCHPTNDIHNKLRIYLNDEWKRQNKEDDVVFDKNTIPGISLGVPQQMNSADCGVYLLHYAELFTLNPFYNSGNSITRNTWFSQSNITQKRMDIKELCIKLRKEQGKHDLDIDDVLKKLEITLESQSAFYDEQEEEIDEYSDEDEDQDDIMEFEDRLWDTEEDLLKDRLAVKARQNPHFRWQITEILDEIDSESNHQTLYNDRYYNGYQK